MNLQTVFDQMEKIYNNEGEELQHMPHNPVIRYSDDGTWELTSSSFSAEDCVRELEVDAFHDYFAAAYNTGYNVTTEDENELIKN